MSRGVQLCRPHSPCQPLTGTRSSYCSIVFIPSSPARLATPEVADRDGLAVSRLAAGKMLYHYIHQTAPV